MIIRRKHTSHFTTVPNATANDRRLKADTLGVLLFLLTKPHDWRVTIANIRERFGIGRNRVYAILGELEGAGYVQRGQSRDPENRFVKIEYLVFDTPEAQAMDARNMEATPLPQIREAALPKEDGDEDRQADQGGGTVTPLPAKQIPAACEKPNKTPASRIPASPKRGRIQRNHLTKSSFGGADAPQEALEEKKTGTNHLASSQPLSLNAQVWAEAKAILSPREFGCVSGWLQRVKDKPKGMETLLAIIETARRQGTGQPVPYIVAALNREFPPPPDPKTITPQRWAVLAQAAINLQTWDSAYGPRPGERGCLMPPHLITPELLRAVSLRRAA